MNIVESKSFGAVCAALVYMISATVVDAQHLRHLPHLSCVTERSITIAWTTADSVETKLLWKPAEERWTTTALQGIRQTHAVVLEKLQPATSYIYRVVAGDDTSAAYAFSTAVEPGTPFRFVAYGDTRSNRTAHVNVLRAIAKVHPDFIINTGDLVGKNAEELWDNYFEDVCSVTGVGMEIPIYSSPGNHEKGAMYHQSVLMPRNNPDHTPDYYSFDYGSVHCISLNSEIGYDSSSAQFRWLLEDVKSDNARRAAFRVAFWHRPPYSSSIHSSDLKVRSILCPVMESNGIDIVFSGHDHVYERTKAMNGTTYIVTGGGGAPLYDFKTENDWTAYKEKTYHLCLISVEGKRLTMTMPRPDGERGDHFVIEK